MKKQLQTLSEWLMLATICLCVFRSTAASTNSNGDAVVQQPASACERSLMNQIASGALVSVGSMSNRTINLAELERLLTVRDQMLLKPDPRCKALGLALQELTDLALLSWATQASEQGLYRTNISQWRRIQNMCAFGEQALKNVLSSVEVGIAPRIHSQLYRETNAVEGRIVEMVEYASKDDLELGSQWKRWKRYAENRMPTEEVAENSESVADFTVARAIRARQQTILCDMFLAALARSDKAWPSDLSDEIAQVIPKNSRRIDNGYEYSAGLVFAQVADMISSDAAVFRMRAASILRPFLTPDQLPESFPFELKANAGFLLPPPG